MCLDWFSSPRGKNMIRPIPGLRLQWSIFSPKTNSYLSKLVTWILKLRDIFERPWRDFCRHGNLWDRSQFSVEAGGLFSNMADFHGHRHLEFLIHLLIGWNLWRPSWICSRNNNLLSFSAPDSLRPLWARYSSCEATSPMTFSYLVHFIAIWFILLQCSK